MPGFIHLNDPASQRHWLIQGEHVAAAELNRADGIIVLHMVGGEEIALTVEEARQFIHHAHPTQVQVQAPGKGQEKGPS